MVDLSIEEAAQTYILNELSVTTNCGNGVECLKHTCKTLVPRHKRGGNCYSQFLVEKHTLEGSNYNIRLKNKVI